MNSTSNWVTPADIFLIRNNEVKWNTGRPIWTHYTHDSKGAWVEQQYIVTVNLEKI